MNNPFSNRVCIDASDYILKKKRLAKIENLKSTQYANYKTSTYHVTSTHVKPDIMKKAPYPKEPNFIPNPLLNYNEIEIHHLNLEQYGDFKVSSQSFDNYDKLSYEAPSYNELYEGQHLSLEKEDYKSPEKHTNIFNPKCKECSNDLSSMKNPPEEWYCDGWNPPHTHCVGGNNIKLGKDDKAYCCPNVQHCNWILCEKCYISIGKKNKTLYCEPCDEEDEEDEEDVEQDEIEKRIKTEAQIMLRDKIENMRKSAPSLKCFSSYEEYLDLAKGFHLTEPFCENTYQNVGLNIDNGKLVENISEARFSVIDMGKDCLYEEKDYHHPINIANKVVYKDTIVNKLRKKKGLINLRATVLPKLKTERIFKFPLTIKKTHFCSNDVDKISHNPVNFSNKKHIRWVPTRNTFLKFYSDDKKPLDNFQLQTDMTQKGKTRVLDFTRKTIQIGISTDHKKCKSKNHKNNHLFKVK